MLDLAFTLAFVGLCIVNGFLQFVVIIFDLVKFEFVQMLEVLTDSFDLFSFDFDEFR